MAGIIRLVPIQMMDGLTAMITGHQGQWELMNQQHISSFSKEHNEILRNCNIVSQYYNKRSAILPCSYYISSNGPPI